MTEEFKKKIIAYKQVFSNAESAQIVLKDLSAFCFENRNTFAEGKPDVQNIRNGRRDVILKIRWYMGLDPNSPETEKIAETEKRFID